MSKIYQIQTNFTTGELDPLLKGRIDIDQYYNGLDKARNVLIQPQGGVTRRPGLEFINTIPAGSPANGCKLVPFEFSTTQSYMLLFVDDKMFVYKDKALVTNINGSGNNFLQTGIASARLANLDFAQSADTLILVEEDLQPKQVVRGANDSTWTISNISFDFIPKYAFSITTTTGTNLNNSTLTPSAVDGNIDLTSSANAFASDNVGDYVETADGLGRARITRFVSATSVEAIVEIPFFNTDAIAADSWFLETDYVDVWSATYGYPRTVTFHEQRLYFGGSKSRPNTVFASRVARFFDFNPGEGLDDDAIEITINTSQVNAITGLFSGRDLQIFTKGGEFFLPQSDLDPITPSNVVVQGSTKRGSLEGIKPLGAESGTLFIQRSGKALREFLFSDVELSYISNNISLLSSHLLSTPVDMALRKATSTDDGDLLMIVNTDGTMAMYSILRGQNVIAPSLASTGMQTCTITVTDFSNIATGATLTFKDNDGTEFTLTCQGAGTGTPDSNKFFHNADNDTTADNIFTAFQNTDLFIVKNPSANVVTVKRRVPGEDNLTVVSSDTTRLAVTNFANTDSFVRVAVDVDTIYCVVKRVINGSTVYNVEAFNDDMTTDSAVLLSGGTKPSNTTFSGLNHLEGENVKLIVDDAMQADKTVSSNQITMESTPVTYCEAGLNYTPKIKTMPVETKLSSGNIMAQKKRIIEVSANIYLTQNLRINRKDIDFVLSDTYNVGDSIPFFTGLKRRKPILGYDRFGQIEFTQSQPLFFTLLAAEYKVGVGQ
jgi:hypothetical protein